MKTAIHRRRASINDASPLFGTNDESNEWHQKIRDILDVSSSDPTLLAQRHGGAVKKKAGPSRRRTMDDGIRPVLRFQTNRTEGVHAEKKPPCESSAYKDLAEKTKAKSVHVAHEDSTASLSWSSESRKVGEGLEFSLSSLDVSPASPSNRRVLSSMYSYERKKSKDSCGDFPLSPFAEEKHDRSPVFHDEEYVSPKSIKVRHFPRRTNAGGDAPALPFDQSPTSVGNPCCPEDLDSSFDAREDKYCSRSAKLHDFQSRRASCGDPPSHPDEKHPLPMQKEQVSPFSQRHAQRLGRVVPPAVPFTFEKPSRSASTGSTKDIQTNRTYSRRLSCSDAPDALHSPYKDADDHGHVLEDPIQSTNPSTTAPKFSIHVRRSSCGDTAAFRDVPLPFSAQRRNSVKSYGRRGSEISFHVPLEKSAKEGMQTKEAERDLSRKGRDDSPPNNIAVPEPGLSMLHSQRRSLNHGEVPRNLGTEKGRRRASCSGPHPKMTNKTTSDHEESQVIHPSISKKNTKSECESEVPSEGDVDCPPISFIVCKKTSKNSKAEEQKLKRGHTAFAYF
ncbi:hypothetical protein HJC23_013658 [Cyclotella cryptica]|uniref:Uncharacterized protein n=1 Tax=Cyclotella cryptica TaxID=29204 RepID=A0ABD3QVB3_9STRA|eukprot:CCRYP_001484-RA/>CCRYP_001484-RA protein AED:0.21 eAED:0.21 QI:0/-1/0/1/-1/1/1/0/560